MEKISLVMKNRRIVKKKGGSGIKQKRVMEL